MERCYELSVLTWIVLGHTGRKNVQLAGWYLVERGNVHLEILGEHFFWHMSQPIWHTVVWYGDSLEDNDTC